MGTKGVRKLFKENQSLRPSQMTLREGNNGKFQSKVGGSSLKSVLRHEHLKKLALWASVDANIPSLAAFFGNRLAAYGQAAGMTPDSQLFSCQRCETILEPGLNCTVRIEKNPFYKSQRKRKKANAPLVQNTVVYTCHFCSHRNLMRGTPKNHMKEINPPNPKTKTPTPKSFNEPRCKVNKDVDVQSPSPLLATDTSAASLREAETPEPARLLDRSRRIRKKSGTKAVEHEPSANGNCQSGGGTSKKKRKKWTSLKDMVQQPSRATITNLKVPFHL